MADTLFVKEHVSTDVQQEYQRVNEESRVRLGIERKTN